MEKGSRVVSDRTIKLICLEFNVNETWLRTGEGSMFNKKDNSLIEEVAKEYKLSAFDKEIMRVYLDLPQNQREEVKKFTLKLLDSIMNNEVLYSEYRVTENALPYAARSGETSNLSDFSDLFDNSKKPD